MTTATSAMDTTLSTLATTASFTFSSSSTNTTSASLGPPPQEKLARGNFLLWKGHCAASDQGRTDGTPSRREKPGTSGHSHHHQGRKRRADCELCPIPLVCTAAATSRLSDGFSFPRHPCSGRDATDADRGVEGHPRHVCCPEPSPSHQYPDRAHQSAKGTLTMAKYLGKIKSLTDEVVCNGAALSDAEITSKILAGLDLEYNPMVSALVARVEPISVRELYSQLPSFDTRLTLLHGTNLQQSSANSASRGRGRGRGHQGTAPTALVTAGSGQTRAKELTLLLVAMATTPEATMASTLGATVSTTTIAVVPPHLAAGLVANFVQSLVTESWTASTTTMKITFPMLVMLLLLCVNKEEMEFGMLTPVPPIMSQAS